MDGKWALSLDIPALSQTPPFTAERPRVCHASGSLVLVYRNGNVTSLMRQKDIGVGPATLGKQLVLLVHGADIQAPRCAHRSFWSWFQLEPSRPFLPALVLPCSCFAFAGEHSQAHPGTRTFPGRNQTRGARKIPVQEGHERNPKRGLLRPGHTAPGP